MKLKKKNTKIGLRFGYKVEQCLIDNKLHYYKIFDSRNGLTLRTYFRLIKGECNPTLQTICKIANALNVHPKELLDFDMNGEPVRPKKIDSYSEQFRLNNPHLFKV